MEWKVWSTCTLSDFLRTLWWATFLRKEKLLLERHTRKDGAILSRLSFTFFRWKYCRTGDPFQGLRMGSYLTLGNELSRETCMRTKQESWWERGTWEENGFAKWLTVSSFMGMGFVSGLSLPIILFSVPPLGLAQGPSWWYVHLSAKIRFQCQESWEVGCLPPPSAPPKFSQFVFRAASCSLSGLPTVRQLMQAATVMLGQAGQFRSVIPLTKGCTNLHFDLLWWDSYLGYCMILCQTDPASRFVLLKD